MSDMYTIDSGSKKKFLAPVTVMLLCMLALTGAGFAYNATMSVPDQTPDAGDLRIDFLNGNPANSIIVTGIDDVVVFTDNIVWSYDTVTDPEHPAWVSTNNVNAFVKDGKIAYQLKISGEGVAQKITIKSDDLAGYLDDEVDDTRAISDLFEVKVGLVEDGTGAKVLGNEAQEFTVSKAANADCEVTVYVFFNAKINAPITLDDADHPAWAAADFKSTIEGGSFSLEFSADSEAVA